MKTMSYRYSKSQKKKQRAIVIVLVLFAVLVFSPLLSLVYDFFEKPFLSAWENSQKTKQKSTALFQSMFNTTKDIEKLEIENARLKIDAERVVFLESQLDLVQSLDKDLDILGSVSAKYPFLQKDMLRVRLSKSTSEEDLSVGSSVYVEPGYYLGKVFEYDDRSALIKKGTFADEELAVVVYPQKISLVAIGNGGQYHIQAPRDVEFNVGDTVYSQDSFGSLVGTVSFIDFDPRNPFKDIYVSLPLSDAYVQTVLFKKNA